MLKKFGYSNIMVLAIGLVIMFVYVDFQTPSKLDVFMMLVFGLTILVYIFKLVLIMFKKGDGK